MAPKTLRTTVFGGLHTEPGCRRKLHSTFLTMILKCCNQFAGQTRAVDCYVSHCWRDGRTMRKAVSLSLSSGRQTWRDRWQHPESYAVTNIQKVLLEQREAKTDYLGLGAGSDRLLDQQNKYLLNAWYTNRVVRDLESHTELKFRRKEHASKQLH